VLSQWGGKSRSGSTAVSEGSDVTLLLYEVKSQTQKGDEKGSVLITVPGQKRGLSQQQFTG